MASVKESFDREWDLLLEYESRFKQVTEDFATGKKVKVYELDEAYADIKRTLKNIRVLAKQVKK